MIFKTAHRNYALEGLRARGRLKTGELNKTEQSYSDYLEGEKRSGRIFDFWFESMKLKVADGSCWYTPDFVVLRPDGRIELHEVKGAPAVFMDDAKIKCKVIADKYPFDFFVIYPRRKKDGGGFDVIPYPTRG